MGRFCYLNLTIGIVTALSVTAVGLVALLVTATTAISKLEDSAQSHAKALGTATAREVHRFVSQTEQQSAAMARNCLMIDEAVVPSHHWTANMSTAEWTSKKIPYGGVEFGRWSEFLRAQVLDGNMSAFMQNLWFVDGSRSGFLQGSQDPDVQFHETFFPLDLNDPLNLTRHVRGYLRSTQGPAPPGHAGAKIVVDFRNTLSISKLGPSGRLFDIYMRLSKRAGVADTPAAQAEAARTVVPTWSTMRFVHRGGPQWYRLSTTRLYNASLYVIGFGFYGLNVPQFSGHLDGQQSTPGSSAVVVDEYGYLLGASHGRPTNNYSTFASWNVNSTTVKELYKVGCTSTDVTKGPAPSDQDMVSCQHHAENFGDPAVQKIAQIGLATHDGALRKLKAGGDSFYVSVVRVKDVGLPCFIIAVVPEGDVLGNVRSIFLISGLVTAAVVIVSAGVLIGIVLLSLRPLKGIAVRMGRAARLEDSQDDKAENKKRSVMREIADLEDAFAEMSHELNRIRAFVPQALLRANKRTSSDDDDVEEDDHGSFHYSGADGSIRSGDGNNAHSYGGDQSLSSIEAAESGSERKYRHASTVGGMSQHPSSGANKRGAAAKTGAGSVSGMSARGRGKAPRGVAALGQAGDQLMKQRVSVLFVNLRGFHRGAAGATGSPAPGEKHTTGGLGATAMLTGTTLVHLQKVEKMIDCVLAIVNDQRGVVDSYHGDRFMVTFNAATACPAHAGRATVTALKIKAVLRDGVPLANVLSVKALQKLNVPPHHVDDMSQTTGATSEPSPTSNSLSFFSQSGNNPHAHHHAASYGLCGITCGVASGLAQVGNLGNSSMMRFSIVGPVVSQAAVLERMCKVYTSATAGVPGVTLVSDVEDIGIDKTVTSDVVLSPVEPVTVSPDAPVGLPGSNSASPDHMLPVPALGGIGSGPSSANHSSPIVPPGGDESGRTSTLERSQTKLHHVTATVARGFGKTSLGCDNEETSILVAQPLFDDLSTAVQLRIVDFVRLPFTKRGCLIAAVDKEVDHSDHADQEWLYQLQVEDPTSMRKPGNNNNNTAASSMNKQRANAPRDLKIVANAAWRAVAEGRVDVAETNIAAINEAAAAAAKLESDGKSPEIPVGFARLAEAVSTAPRGAADARPRELGVFYEAAIAN